MTTLVLRHIPRRLNAPLAHVLEYLPGIGLCALLALVSFELARWPALNRIMPMSALTIGIFAGVAVRLCVPRLAPFEAGIRWTLHYGLRAGVVLLGFRLALPDLVSVGFGGLALVIAAVGSTLTLTIALGRALKLPDTLSVVVGTGASICGASAVVAVDGVVRAREQDVACAVALVTVFGTAAMFVDPLLGHALGLSESTFAAWVGISIHEVAQVLAAGFAFGPQAGPDASLFKLARVAMLVPVCAALGVWWQARRRGGDSERAGGGARFPLFIVFFGLVVLVNSFVPIGHASHERLVQFDGCLLAIAMVAMGLQTRVASIVGLGWRPIALGVFATLWIGALGLGGAMLLVG